MLASDFASVRVGIEYANMAKLNKIRTWAKRNGATVKVSRYAKDAYEGYVSIPSPWNEGRDVAQAKAAELRKLLAA